MQIKLLTLVSSGGNGFVNYKAFRSSNARALACSPIVANGLQGSFLEIAMFCYYRLFFLFVYYFSNF